jgi:hypothetical protein
VNIECLIRIVSRDIKNKIIIRPLKSPIVSEIARNSTRELFRTSPTMFDVLVVYIYRSMLYKTSSNTQKS